MRTALCSGSFDPITLGHLDVIRRAAACFDRVVVCVSPNAEKRSQMFTPEQKLLPEQLLFLSCRKEPVLRFLQYLHCSYPLFYSS